MVGLSHAGLSHRLGSQPHILSPSQPLTVLSINKNPLQSLSSLPILCIALASLVLLNAASLGQAGQGILEWCFRQLFQIRTLGHLHLLFLKYKLALPRDDLVPSVAASMVVMLSISYYLYCWRGVKAE
ncbi:hypothetical protein QBC35DRAFT_500433 [Podospora australis]|uniref:Uncharacterized protein n=1 Tax=Podospora australis TaxID=1536484 RepID=A0AAN6WSK3_9PEZI|nr:hypothetical protein QBC35DRAFT_500433 [Podospora australis]